MDIGNSVAFDLFARDNFDDVSKYLVVEKPWLMFASAPVLSDPDWMLMIPGRVSHS